MMMELQSGDRLYIDYSQTRFGLFKAYGNDKKLKKFGIKYKFLIYNQSQSRREWIRVREDIINLD